MWHTTLPNGRGSLVPNYPNHARWIYRCLAVLGLGAVCLGMRPLGAGEKGGPESAATFKGHTELVYTVAFSPDGKFLATGSFDNTVKLWDAATGKELKTFGGAAGHQKMVLSVAFSNDGTMIASGG